MASVEFGELVRSSALSVARSGKDLSDGWVVNFAIGCTHGCVFVMWIGFGDFIL
jgi:hypothetical protein